MRCFDFPDEAADGASAAALTAARTEIPETTRAEEQMKSVI